MDFYNWRIFFVTLAVFICHSNCYSFDLIDDQCEVFRMVEEFNTEKGVVLYMHGSAALYYQHSTKEPRDLDFFVEPRYFEDFFCFLKERCPQFYCRKVNIEGRKDFLLMKVHSKEEGKRGVADVYGKSIKECHLTSRTIANRNISLLTLGGILAHEDECLTSVKEDCRRYIDKMSTNVGWYSTTGCLSAISSIQKLFEKYEEHKKIYKAKHKKIYCGDEKEFSDAQIAFDNLKLAKTHALNSQILSHYMRDSSIALNKKAHATSQTEPSSDDLVKQLDAAVLERKQLKDQLFDAEKQLRTANIDHDKKEAELKEQVRMKEAELKEQVRMRDAITAQVAELYSEKSVFENRVLEQDHELKKLKKLKEVKAEKEKLERERDKEKRERDKKESAKRYVQLKATQKVTIDKFQRKSRQDDNKIAALKEGISALQKKHQVLLDEKPRIKGPDQFLSDYHPRGISEYSDGSLSQGRESGFGDDSDQPPTELPFSEKLPTSETDNLSLTVPTQQAPLLQESESNDTDTPSHLRQNIGDGTEATMLDPDENKARLAFIAFINRIKKYAPTSLFQHSGLAFMLDKANSVVIYPVTIGMSGLYQIRTFLDSLINDSDAELAAQLLCVGCSSQYFFDRLEIVPEGYPFPKMVSGALCYETAYLSLKSMALSGKVKKETYRRTQLIMAGMFLVVVVSIYNQDPDVREEAISALSYIFNQILLFGAAGFLPGYTCNQFFLWMRERKVELKRKKQVVSANEKGWNKAMKIPLDLSMDEKIDATDRFINIFRISFALLLFVVFGSGWM